MLDQKDAELNPQTAGMNLCKIDIEEAGRVLTIGF